MYICNVSEDVLRITLTSRQYARWPRAKTLLFVPVCAAIESEIAELDDEDKEEFLSSMGS